jgi:hypothetical protein
MNDKMKYKDRHAVRSVPALETPEAGVASAPPAFNPNQMKASAPGDASSAVCIADL